MMAAKKEMESLTRAIEKSFIEIATMCWENDSQLVL